jgi:hypothetical protein
LLVLLGNGDGTFDGPFEYPVGQNLDAIAILDLNRDSRQDVVVASTTTTGLQGSSVNVLFGNGDGTLQPAQPLLVGRSPVALAGQDMNHDGNLDIVTANASLPASYSSFDIGVVLSNGDGTFVQPTPLATEAGPVDVTSGLLNRDCLPDFVVAASDANAVSVLVAKPGGGYEPAVSYPLGAPVLRVLLGDFTGDYNTDLQVTTTTGIYRLTGNGDGTLGAPIPMGGTGSPGALLSDDFNGDGRADTAVISTGINGCVSITLGGTSSWSACIPVGQFPTGLAAGDVNGDLRDDLVVAVSGDAQLQVLLGNGDGTFQAPAPTAVGLPSSEVALGDVDGDHDVDAVTTGDDKIRVLFNDGKGGFDGAIEYVARLYSVSNLQVVDLDQDGARDIVGTRRLANQLVVRRNLGDGTFGEELSYVVGTDPYGLNVGDFDIDGDKDVAVTARSGSGITLLALGCTK